MDTDIDTDMNAADQKNLRLLEQRMLAAGFVRYPGYDFWVSPENTLTVPTQPDESDEG
jgi:hypothetical protein